MDKYIKYIATVLNLDLDEMQAIRMAEKLKELGSGVVEFREFVEHNFSKVTYATGYQRFLILLRNFNEQRRDDSTLDGAAYSLFCKTKEFLAGLNAALLRNEVPSINDDGVTAAIYRHFTEDEMVMLAKIGNRDVLMQHWRHSPSELERLIIKAYKNILNKNTLEYKTPSSMKLLEAAHG